MIQVLTSLALFLLIIIHGQKVIKAHLCPSDIINHQAEKKIAELFTKNISLERQKIELGHLRKCRDVIRLGTDGTSFNQKRKVQIQFQGKLEK